jgi:hypothetical protein
MTPPGHLRPSYRNFFPARMRWQFAGFRVRMTHDSTASSETKGETR